ncbi:MAG: class I SAM-dependent methyltransferase [Acidimicrobiales bacterium]
MPNSTARARHWDAAYESRGVTGVSWFQTEHTVSLELFALLEISPGAAIIDIGGGSSLLLDRLLGLGYTDLSVLDVSETALGGARKRVGQGAPVSWLRQDLLSWHPERRYDLWHDRAVFHFLTEDTDREAYLDRLHSSLAPNGGLVMATFAEDGPEYCSGLPVSRYSADALSNVLGPRFEVVEVRRELHTTPAESTNPSRGLLLGWSDDEGHKRARTRNCGSPRSGLPIVKRQTSTVEPGASANLRPVGTGAAEGCIRHSKRRRLLARWRSRPRRSTSQRSCADQYKQCRRVQTHSAGAGVVRPNPVNLDAVDPRRMWETWGAGNANDAIPFPDALAMDGRSPILKREGCPSMTLEQKCRWNPSVIVDAAQPGLYVPSERASSAPSSPFPRATTRRMVRTRSA